MGWEDSEGWLTLIWVAAAALLAVAGIIAVGETPAPDDDSWPAWVQAGGSVAAILAVFWVQRRDHARADRLRLADAAERSALEAEALNLMIAYARVTIEQAQASCRSRKWTEATARYALAQMQSHLASFDATSVARLPDRRVVSVYFRGRQALIAAVRQVEMVLEYLPKQPSASFFDTPADIVKGLTEDLATYVPERR